MINGLVSINEINIFECKWHIYEIDFQVFCVAVAEQVRLFDYANKYTRE